MPGSRKVNFTKTVLLPSNNQAKRRVRSWGHELLVYNNIRVCGIASIAVTFGLSIPAQAGVTNCWVSSFKHKLDRMLVSSDRCDTPIFYLTKGEVNSIIAQILTMFGINFDF